jgi:phage/plasmid-associated DNA primase
MGIKSNDHGTWRRIRTVPFKSLFTEKPVSGDKDKPYQFKIDKYIDEKFDRWKEVMASMLVDIVYKTDGVAEDCSIVLEKSNEYRESQDYISEFIKDRVIKDSEGRIKKTELNNDFSIWYASNYGGRGPSPKDLHEYMDKQYGRIRNQAWNGVRIRYEQDNEDDGFEKESDNNITNDDL